MENLSITEHLDAAMMVMRQATIGNYDGRFEKITSAIRHIKDAKEELDKISNVVVLHRGKDLRGVVESNDMADKVGNGFVNILVTADAVQIGYSRDE